MAQVRLWLDDKRPAPEGYLHAKTAIEAIEILAAHDVTDASLDHDLGHCEKCTECNGYKSACGCRCHWTGYSVVLWMTATGRWPRTCPKVHSANPAGAANMRATIDRYFGSAMTFPKGEFRLSWKEQERAEEFEQRHLRKCKPGAPKQFDVPYVAFSYRFTNTGMGTAVWVSCSACKKRRNVTEYEVW